MKLRKKNLLLLINLTLVAIVYYLYLCPENPNAAAKNVTALTDDEVETYSGIEDLDDSDGTILLDVPLENQFTDSALGNGCEVTALSMLLNTYDYQVDKNQLADQLTYEPLITASGNYGNPHEGFVGNIYGGTQAMGVAVEPIAELAEEFVDDSQYQVVSSSEAEIADILAVVAEGNPVWTIVTADLVVPTAEDFRTWETDEGTLTVSPLIHSVVITGYDTSAEVVYVNDPFGYKNRVVSYDDFVTIYEAMGSQSLYLEAA